MVLIAEDHSINQKAVIHQLELLGCRTVLTANGVEALAYWQAQPIDLVLTDLHMPDMDGYALTRAIREEELRRGTGQRTPIVVFSANVGRGEAERCLELGVDDFIAKPVRMTELADKLHRWLQHSPTAPPAAATAASGVSEEPILDTSVLANLVGADPDTILDFLTEFSRSTRALMPNLIIAVEQDDRATTIQLAHRLKSSACTVGALALGKLFASLEVAADGDPQKSLGQLWPRVLTAWIEVSEELKRRNVTTHD